MHSEPAPAYVRLLCIHFLTVKMSPPPVAAAGVVTGLPVGLAVRAGEDKDSLLPQEERPKRARRLQSTFMLEQDIGFGI
jgi:hypothetical protein